MSDRPFTSLLDKLERNEPLSELERRILVLEGRSVLVREEIEERLCEGAIEDRDNAWELCAALRLERDALLKRVERLENAVYNVCTDRDAAHTLNAEVRDLPWYLRDNRWVVSGSMAQWFEELIGTYHPDNASEVE